jgi:hypothetical protein
MGLRPTDAEIIMRRHWRSKKMQQETKAPAPRSIVPCELQSSLEAVEAAADQPPSDDPRDKYRASPGAQWPSISSAAYHGLAGDIVHAIDPHTEADPVAILVHFLAFFGNAVGRGPHYFVEARHHFATLNAIVVGESGNSRKGTAAAHVRQIFYGADREWVETRITSGLSSGEGLLFQVRDAVKEGEKIIDAGVDDKRLLVLEPEFAQSSIAMRRPGNTLNPVVRQLWDGDIVGTLVKKTPLRVACPHVSIIGHITMEELRKCLDRTSMDNGYANRFLFVCARRSKLLPHGGALNNATVDELAARTQQAIIAARKVARVSMTDDARAMWEGIYPELSANRPGLTGAILARAEAQTVRLALTYALLDRVDRIDVTHLKAALALWQYAEASVHCVFDEIVGDAIANAILPALRRAGPDGMTRTQIRDHFARHRAAEITTALQQLVAGHKAMSTRRSTGGRAAEVWIALQ